MTLPWVSWAAFLKLLYSTAINPTWCILSGCSWTWSWTFYSTTINHINIYIWVSLAAVFEPEVENLYSPTMNPTWSILSCYFWTSLLCCYKSYLEYLELMFLNLELNLSTIKMLLKTFLYFNLYIWHLLEKYQKEEIGIFSSDPSFKEHTCPIHNGTL